MRREGMPKVDEIACVKPPRSWARDFYFYVGRQALKAEKKMKPLKLEHIEVQLNKVNRKSQCRRMCDSVGIREIEALGVDQGQLTAHPIKRITCQPGTSIADDQG